MRRSIPAISLLLTGVLAATGIACREVAPKVTAVRIIVTAPPKPVTQIEFSLQTVEDPQNLLPPTRMPTVAGAPLIGQQDLVVYLDDDQANIDVRCTATALDGSGPVATGSAITRLALQQVVECRPLGTTDGGAVDAPPDIAPDAPTEQGRDSLLDLGLPDLLPGVGLPPI